MRRLNATLYSNKPFKCPQTPPRTPTGPHSTLNTRSRTLVTRRRPLPAQVGSIEHVDHPYVPTTVFTQADVDANKIVYRPPPSRMQRSPEHFANTQQYVSSIFYRNGGRVQQLPQNTGYRAPSASTLSM